MAAERPPDRLGQRLGAVDDEQAADRRVQAAPNQTFEQCLHGCSTFGGALDRAKRMLAPLRVEPNGSRLATPTNLFQHRTGHPQQTLAPLRISVGTPVTGRPPDRSEHALLTHSAPTSGV